MQPLFLTSQRLITQHWATVAQLLEPVLGAARGEFAIEDLEELCRDGRALAALVLDEGEPLLAFVVEWRFYPRKTALNVVALGGRDLERVASTFWPTFTAWAKESGASEIEACTAPAMTRMLRPLGFKHTYDTVRMQCH